MYSGADKTVTLTTTYKLTQKTYRLNCIMYYFFPIPGKVSSFFSKEYVYAHFQHHLIVCCRVNTSCYKHLMKIDCMPRTALK